VYFLASLAPPLELRDDPAYIDRVLTELFDAARAVTPTATVSLGAFATYLGQRFPADGDSIDALRRLNVSDLYVACACASEDRAALAGFEGRYLAHLRAVAADEARTAELKQVLLEKLFVGGPSARPKILDYSGKGDLAGWIRVAAVRTSLNLARGRNRDVALDDADALADRATERDPELEPMRNLYRPQFATAIRSAFARLDPRERTMLHQHYVDGLTMDQIGTIYRLHRITVVRRMNRARAHLAEEVRKELSGALQADTRELHSIIRLVRSHLHLSLRAVFGEDRASAAWGLKPGT
jgi:RNA polymerase sigma-70 factor (ECF subfamily)